MSTTITTLTANECKPRRHCTRSCPIFVWGGQKVRPVLVVQSDHNNARLADTVVAVITSNIRRADQEPTQLLVDSGTPDGAQSGLLRPSAVTCERLHTILQADIRRKIGSLPPGLMRRINDCLKVSLGLT